MYSKPELKFQKWSIFVLIEAEKTKAKVGI